LVTNGGFNADANWTKGTGWTISGGSANYNNTAGFNFLSQNVGLQINTTYILTFDIIVTSGGLIDIRAGGSTAGFAVHGAMTTSGSKTVYMHVTGSNGRIYFLPNSGSFVGSIDNVVVRAISGNHATQATASKRLTYKLSTGYDLYCDGVDDSLTAMTGGGSTTAFFFCAAIRLDNTGATQTIWSDTGTNTGYRVRINSSNQLEMAVGNGSAYTTVNTSATLALGQRAIITCWHDGAVIYAQIDQGAITSTAFATASAGTNGFTIGQDNGASSSYFKGGIIGLVQIKNVIHADGARAHLQRYLAQRGLITL